MTLPIFPVGIAGFYVNLTKARIICEKGASVEKVLPTRGPVDKSVVHFLH